MAIPAPEIQDSELQELEHAGRIYRCRLMPSFRNRNIRMRLVVEEKPGAGALHGAPTVRTAAGLDTGAGYLPGFDRRTAFVVRVTYPPRLSKKQVLSVVQDHLNWVEKQIQRRLSAPTGIGKQALVTGARLYFRGQRLTLYVLPVPRQQPSVILTEEKLVCQTQRLRQQDLKRLLESWYRKQADEVLGERLHALASDITRKPYRLVIRTQKSRWGSCSENRTLSLNWKLIMMPDFVMNYVLVHELAHLEELNHSARFWQIVRRHCPYVDSAKKWLHRHGPELEW